MEGSLNNERLPTVAPAAPTVVPAAAATTTAPAAPTAVPAAAAVNPALLAQRSEERFKQREGELQKAIGKLVAQQQSSRMSGGFGMRNSGKIKKLKKAFEQSEAQNRATIDAAAEALLVSNAAGSSDLLGLNNPVSIPGGELPPGGELAGFDPSQNISDLTEEGLTDLENSARGNTLRDLTDLLGAEFDDLGPLLQAEADRRGEAELSGDAFADILRQSLGASSSATPEQLERINAIAESNIERSASDIDASLGRGLEQLREESGASRGLRFTDTPIFEAAQESVNEAQRLQSQSINSARGAQAEAELNLPLALQQLEFQRAGIAQNARSFEEQLAQKAFANRATLFGNAQGFGLDLLNASPSANEIKFGSDRLAFEKSEGRKNRQSAQDDRKLGVISGLFS